VFDERTSEPSDEVLTEINATQMGRMWTVKCNLQFAILQCPVCAKIQSLFQRYRAIYELPEEERRA
jgi:hypothetical protein